MQEVHLAKWTARTFFLNTSAECDTPISWKAIRDTHSLMFSSDEFNYLGRIFHKLIYLKSKGSSTSRAVASSLHAHED